MLPARGLRNSIPLALRWMAKLTWSARVISRDSFRGLAHLGADHPDHLLGEVEVLQRDLLHQLPQAALAGFVLHPVDLFHPGGVHKLAHLAAKAQPPAGDDALMPFFVDDAQNVVVDDFFDPHSAASLRCCIQRADKKTNPFKCPLS